MEEWTRELEGLVARFRAGEAEVAAEFFGGKRPRNEHAAWLRFQIAREARNLEEIANHQRCDLVEHVDTTGSREALVDLLMEDYQEIRHYAMLAHLYEGLTGERVEWRQLRETAKAAPWYDLSRKEHTRWAEFKQTGSPLELAAALFTRGGGGALFYGFLSLSGGDYEFLLSEASKIILNDELEHGASEGRDELFKLIHKPEDIDVAKKIVTEMSQIRLAMRNEQFSRPLSERRLEEIAAGQIRPLTVSTMVAACQNRLPDWFDVFHRKKKPLTNQSVID
ncbi:MAG TPA: hypothetical protein VEG60_28290 [Candidatus Binatia bacterium]|nr:hypothetical protein [Candidatus Binatia bacterium]